MATSSRPGSASVTSPFNLVADSTRPWKAPLQPWDRQQSGCRIPLNPDETRLSSLRQIQAGERHGQYGPLVRPERRAQLEVADETIPTAQEPPDPLSHLVPGGGPQLDSVHLLTDVQAGPVSIADANPLITPPTGLVRSLVALLTSC